MHDSTAAERLIADIRRRSGLSQAELARRTGLTQSVLSAYARGRRQPGVDALARIAAAAGLEVQVGPAVERGSAVAEGAGAAQALPKTAAERMARTRAAWAQGALEGKELDRRRARAMSHEQRISEGLALVRIAEQLKSGSSAP